MKTSMVVLQPGATAPVCIKSTGWGKKKYDCLMYYNVKSKRAITLK